MNKNLREQRILVTGGCGFIGSNLILHLASRHSGWRIANIDSLTYAANPHALDEISGSSNYEFHAIDITDRVELAAFIREFRPDGILHLAAESHVDNSITGPSEFIQTNVIGTFNLLEEARHLWGAADQGRFLHVSTDEVFGSLGNEGLFSETSNYNPSSPYSASKAGSDHLVTAWNRTYGIDTVTTNCSNNFGPRQHSEKLIPTVIASALEHRAIPVYGQGLNVRDWLYVQDHCEAIEMAFLAGESGRSYCVGARNEWRNIDLVRLICRLLDEEVGEGPSGGYASLIAYVADRPGHDLRYAVDPSRIEQELGWRPAHSFEEGMRCTVKWYSVSATPL